MMELVIKRERQGDGKTLKGYELGNYEVSVITYDSGYQYLTIRTDRRNRYQPEIYPREDGEGNVIGFDIQTTSYGALQSDQIRKVIEAMEEAIKAVDVLTEAFVKEVG